MYSRIRTFGRGTAIRFFTLLLLAALAAGCASTQTSPPSVPLPPTRYEHRAFSLVPLNQPGWLVLARNPTQLALAKPGGAPDESFAIQAGTTTLPAYASPQAFFAEMGKPVNQASPTSSLGRFKPLSHSARPAPEKGDLCVRMHTVSEDQSPTRFSGRTEPMILEGYTLLCAHPKDRRIGLVISYSQRYYRGNRDPQLEKSADTLLGSVTVSDL